MGCGLRKGGFLRLGGELVICTSHDRYLHAVNDLVPGTRKHLYQSKVSKIQSVSHNGVTYCQPGKAGNDVTMDQSGRQIDG